MECTTSSILPVTQHGHNAIKDFFLSRVLELNRGIVIALLLTIGQTTFQSLSSVSMKTTEKQSQNPDILGNLESHI